MDATRRSLLRGTVALALLAGAGPVFAQFGPKSRRRSAPVETGDFPLIDGAIAYGWNPEIAGPTEASFHVAPGGRKGARGTASDPFATLAEGVAALARLKTGSLALHEGLYREAVSLDALQGRPQADGRPAYLIHRRGRDRVRITAADELRGWTRCSPEEVAGFGLGEAPLYRISLPLERLRHGEPAALNLHERGFWCPLASLAGETGPEPHLFDHRQFRPSRFETAEAQGEVRALYDPALRGARPEHLADGSLVLFQKGNRIGRAPIAGFDPAAGRVVLPKANKIRAPEPEKQAYRLQNYPPALTRGGWFFRRGPEGVTIYFWPRAPERIEEGVEASLRDHCIDFGRAESLELFGLEAVRAAGRGRAEGCCIRRIQDKTVSRDLRLTHCRAGETITSQGGGFGAIFLRGVEGLRLRHCSVETCRAGFGLFLNACREADLRYLHFEGISFSPARFYGLRGGVFAFSRMRRSGWDTHANKFNFYLGSDRVLAYGLKAEETGGYATYQSASRIHFAFCDLDGVPGGSLRIIASQNYPPGAGKGGEDGSGDPVPGASFWFWNLTLLPRSPGRHQANALNLGPSGSSHRHEIHNCLLQGGGFAPIYTKQSPRSGERRSYNRYTGRAFWQGTKYGWSLAEGEADHPAQHGRDPATLGPGADLSARIQAEIAPLFPGFTDWDRDIEGRRFDWRHPPIGAYAAG